MTDISCFAFAAEGTDSANGNTYRLEQVDLGNLVIRSGELEACDPFVYLGESPNRFQIPPGNHRVVVTRAFISEGEKPHLRCAYLSVLLSDEFPTQFAHAIPIGSSADELPEGQFFGLPVDAGMVGFTDARAAHTACAQLDAQGLDLDTVVEEDEGCWMEMIDDPDHYREEVANVPLPLIDTGENVVMCTAGWGDGYYPVIAGFNDANQLISYHIDLFVVG